MQINTGEEPQKAGVAPGDADAFIAACREKYGLVISGLMCIPPVDEPPAPHFALTAKIAARNGLKNLSMGMSADFAVAIAMGATHVRVGSAIFGHRGHRSVVPAALLREAGVQLRGQLLLGEGLPVPVAIAHSAGRRSESAMRSRYLNPTDTFPSTPKSASIRSPEAIGNGGWQVPVVTTSPARSVMPSSRSSLASQASATRGSPSTFLP